jgi:hypothetical protein
MVQLADAVIAIKSDAEVNISGEDVTTIVWLDGNPTNITNQQILDKKTELDAAEESAATQKATDKSSGNQKLLNLGLSQAEVDALTS